MKSIANTNINQYFGKKYCQYQYRYRHFFDNTFFELHHVGLNNINNSNCNPNPNPTHNPDPNLNHGLDVAFCIYVIVLRCGAKTEESPKVVWFPLQTGLWVGQLGQYCYM